MAFEVTELQDRGAHLQRFIETRFIEARSQCLVQFRIWKVRLENRGEALEVVNMGIMDGGFQESAHGDCAPQALVQVSPAAWQDSAQRCMTMDLTGAEFGDCPLLLKRC